MKPKYNLLDVIPYKADHIVTEQEDGLAVLTYPRFKKKWVAKLLLPKRMPPNIRVRLEEHGSAVWELIDGIRTVGEIADLLAEHFTGQDNYQSRVTVFITQLRKDGFIKYFVKD